jgi:glycosyltransferase involved in cell wall biosynthesis
MDHTAHERDIGGVPKQPLLSIIIPAYKVAPFINETLNSVFVQTFTDYEVIVINDGSPDTEELEGTLDHYRSRILYIRQDNRGAGAARNAGLRTARGRFIAFLDGDDVWLPNFLSEQVRLIQSNGGYADALNFGDSAWAGLKSMKTNPSEGEVTFESLLAGRCCVITSAVLARRDLIIQVGLFDEDFPNSQDFDLWLRLARDAKARMTYQRKVLVCRRIYEGSLAADAVKSFNGELRVLEKVRQRADLTESEHAILEPTIALRIATVEIIKGKRFLMEGDFDDALKSFDSAQKYFRSWKLRLVLFCLQIAPRLVRRVYKLRPT